MKEMLKKPLSKNQLDDLTNGLVNAMRYSDPSVIYPSFDKAKANDGVNPEWFYPIYNGTNDFSELTAIHMYVSQESTFEEIGETMLGIAMTEMKHYDKLGDFILKIGGKINQIYSNEDSEIGEDVIDAINIAIRGEEKTIEFYDDVSKKIKDEESTDTTEVALQLISKIRADEVVHLNILKELKQRNEK